MTPEIEPLWATLYDEVVNLHAYWIIYEQLFGKSRVRYELLYASARNLFLVVEDGIGTDIQLTLAKLSDPPAMGGYQNATLSRLLEDVARITGNDPLVSRIESYLAEFRAACGPIRDRRNRLIAHSDLSTVLKDGSRPALPAPTIQEIEVALLALRNFMNTISRVFGETETAFEHFLSREDGDDLVHLLKMGQRYNRLQESGGIPWNDLEQSEYRDA